MELEVTWGRTVKVWWAYLWRAIIAMIAGAVAGVIVGGIIGLILGLLGAPIHIVPFITAPIGLGMGLAISIVPIKLILGKDFGEFRLVLLQKENGV